MKLEYLLENAQTLIICENKPEPSRSQKVMTEKHRFSGFFDIFVQNLSSYLPVLVMELKERQQKVIKLIICET